MRELASCLPPEEPIADAYLKALSAVADASQYRALDFWILLVLHGRKPSTQKAVEALLRKKIVENKAATAKWILRAIKDHQVGRCASLVHT